MNFCWDLAILPDFAEGESKTAIGALDHYLKKLDCTKGAVIRRKVTGNEIIASLPEKPDDDPAWNVLCGFIDENHSQSANKRRRT